MLEHTSTHKPQSFGGLVVLLEQRSPNLLRFLDAEFFAHELPHVLPLQVGADRRAGNKKQEGKNQQQSPLLWLVARGYPVYAEVS